VDCQQSLGGIVNNAQRHPPRLGGRTTAGRLVCVTASPQLPAHRDAANFSPGQMRNCPEIDIDPPVPIGQSHDRGNSAAYSLLFSKKRKSFSVVRACPDSEISAFGVPSSLSLFLARFNAKPDARAVACVSR
jgi:hypothetical protein